MCGGSLSVNEGDVIVTCDYCGSTQTLPKLNDEKIARLYDRANHFRRNNEFDKAMEMYEEILAEDNTDAEAYWSIVLCNYGIEYVEDPRSRRRIPTVNRAQYTSVFDDENYLSAIKYADSERRRVYEDEAKVINDIQREILAISEREEPYDVFICYKETDENGQRTHDSVYANDLYNELTEQGFKVFYAKISLEGKLGSAYEPIIFAALHSAKVMVVMGTKPEYFNAVWVKNEWSRYLSLIRKGEKKMLIPAYKDMDPYYLPKEFSHLQAQNMGLLGFMFDLVRGIKKQLGEYEEPRSHHDYSSASTSKNSGAEIENLLKRVTIFLDNGDYGDADLYCEKVLDKDPENGEAYLYKLLAELRIPDVKKLDKCNTPLDGAKAYKNAVRYADTEISEMLVDVNGKVKERIKREQDERAERELRAAEERAARERESREKAARAAKLREERAALERARDNAANHVKSLVNTREGITKSIAEKENEIVSYPVKKIRITSLLSILCVVLFFVGVIIASAAAADPDLSVDDSEALIVLGVIMILTAFIGFIVFSVILAKCEKRSIMATMGLSYVSAGIYAVVVAIKAFFKSLKNPADALRGEISVLNLRLHDLDAQIYNARSALKELNEKLDNFNANSVV